MTGTRGLRAWRVRRLHRAGGRLFGARLPDAGGAGRGREIGTVEGLARPDGSLHPIQQAFHELHGLQCGFCTPGILMSVAELLAHEPDPDEARIRDVLSGHLCRCTGYQNIVDAVLLAARRMRGVAHERPRSGRTRRGRRDGEGTPRIEDAALLRGEARFLDDIPVATPLHACFVRSPHAHARIVSIDLSAARAMPGVTAAYAAADLYGELTEWRMPLGFALADLPANTTPFVLAGSEVAFAGEAVTVVLADSRRQAETRRRSPGGV